MKSIPLPSHIHYELLLQLLERYTMPAVSDLKEQREQVHQIAIEIRKALAIQKQLEQSCDRAKLEIEYRWSLSSLNEHSVPKMPQEPKV